MSEPVEGPKSSSTPSPPAATTDAPNSSDGLDPLSVSLASSEPDPILRVGAAPAPDPGPEEVPERRGPSWPFVLLGSYASALTLACGWLVWERHSDRERPIADSAPLETRTDAGLRGDRSRRIAVAHPIPEDHRTTLGKAIRVGSLEITPLETRSDRVTLEHMGDRGGQDRRTAASKALQLRVRLRNLSDDAIFAPLDEAFLREHERGEPESYIITGTGERIPLYPLAVQSEWSIVGQEFRELKPGEAMETWIVSAPDEAHDRARPPLTWSLRLRTGIDLTDVVEVRVGDRPGASPEGGDHRHKP